MKKWTYLGKRAIYKFLCECVFLRERDYGLFVVDEFSDCKYSFYRGTEFFDCEDFRVYVVRGKELCVTTLSYKGERRVEVCSRRFVLVNGIWELVYERIGRRITISRTLD